MAQLVDIYPSDLGTVELQQLGAARSAIDAVLPFGGYITYEQCRQAVLKSPKVNPQYADRLTCVVLRQLGNGIGAAFANPVPPGPDGELVFHIQR